MARFYLEADCERSLLEGKTVGVLGYGNQGRAQALNLRDSGVRVVVGLREGSSAAERALADGVEIAGLRDAIGRADIIALLVPDEAHGQLFEEHVVPAAKKTAALCLAHGLSIRFGLLKPPQGMDVFMIAPLGAGSVLRELYLENRGLPGYIAVHQDHTGKALGVALAYAAAIGCARAGVLETTFEEEAEVDLFGEQAVLCGGIAFLLLEAFEILVENGYDPEVAYMECINQLKASADLISTEGLDGFAGSISSPALYGMLTRGRRVIGREAQRGLKELLNEIRSGKFVEDWKVRGTRNSPDLRRLLAEWKSLKVHQVGRELRRRMGKPGDEEKPA